jgi:hypothetical protein
MPVVGTSWGHEDHANNRVAQLYGGYVLRGSQLDVSGGVGLVVSQWDTSRGWPYRAMQFKATVNDTTTTGLSSFTRRGQSLIPGGGIASLPT